MKKVFVKRNNFFEIKNYHLRRIFDLQFETIVNVLKYQLKTVPKDLTVLDVGSGTVPYLDLFIKNGHQIVTVDKYCSADYNSLEEVPIDTEPMIILLIEVLEHLQEPKELLTQVQEKFPCALVWISVPFSARVHGVPDDYHRWTPLGLEKLLLACGYKVKKIITRGNDFATIVSKINYFTLRHLFKPLTFWLAFILLVLVIPLLLFFSHLLLRFSHCSQEDPLGYFVVATR